MPSLHVTALDDRGIARASIGLRLALSLRLRRALAGAAAASTRAAATRGAGEHSNGMTETVGGILRQVAQLGPGGQGCSW